MRRNDNDVRIALIAMFCICALNTILSILLVEAVVL